MRMKHLMWRESMCICVWGCVCDERERGREGEEEGEGEGGREGGRKRKREREREREKERESKPWRLLQHLP